MRVFDASAVLALLFHEPGAELAARWLAEDEAVISSVNQAEVLTKLRDKGFAEADLTAIDQHLPLQVIPFSADHARLAANLRPATRATRLSLGDRCCLALAQALTGAQVVTADRAWAGLAGFDIALLR